MFAAAARHSPNVTNVGAWLAFGFACLVSVLV